MHHTCIMQIVRFSVGSGEEEGGEERREEKEAMKEGGAGVMENRNISLAIYKQSKPEIISERRAMSQKI